LTDEAFPETVLIELEMLAGATEMSLVRGKKWVAVAFAMLGTTGLSNRAIAQTTLPSNPPTTPTQPATPPTNRTPARSVKPEPKKQPQPTQFPPNPLEISEPLDSLIPFDYKDRPLTADEREEISKAADRLAIIGVERLKVNDVPGSYEAWNQELRYRRVLGSLTDETRALGRVGDVAWGQNNQQQLRYITKRLDAIRLQTEVPIARLQNDRQASDELLNPAKRIALIEALGFAYQQVRLPKIAASLFEQVVADARQRDDNLRLEATLINLGQLHLGWFDYANAAKVYQELWQRSQARQDVFNEPIYLNRLVFIYEQSKKPRETIFYQQQLIEFYRKTNDPKPVPALITRIADNQRTLGQLDRAEANYQLAYKAATPQLQFADAGDALKKLGDMYRANKRLEAAERIYTFLVSVEQQAYNAYGMMDAFDQLGQLQAQQENFSGAIASFQSALEIARQLKFREDYFTVQIQKISAKVSQ